MWTDSHCHLAGQEYDADRAEVLKRAREAKVETFVVIGAGDGLEGNKRAIQLAEGEQGVYATLGIHPHDASQVDEEGTYLKELKKWASHPRVVGLGEMGLDYHYKHSTPETQKKRFCEQILLAKELKLPIVIHSREAWQDTINVLKEAGPPARGGVFHCFGGTLEEAKQAIDLGFYISISGIVTFKKADLLIEVVKQIPLEKMLIETDAPFLAPVPHRGKRNEPAFVALVGEKIAEIKKMPIEEVGRVTTSNAKKLFAIAAV